MMVLISAMALGSNVNTLIDTMSPAFGIQRMFLYHVVVTPMADRAGWSTGAANRTFSVLRISRLLRQEPVA